MTLGKIITLALFVAAAVFADDHSAKATGVHHPLLARRLLRTDHHGYPYTGSADGADTASIIGTSSPSCATSLLKMFEKSTLVRTPACAGPGPSNVNSCSVLA